MAQLPLQDAVARLQENEDRFQTFVNGGETEEYISSEADNVPSVQKFLAAMAAIVEASYGQAASEAALQAYTNFIAAAPTTAKVLYQGTPAVGATTIPLSEAVTHHGQVNLYRGGGAIQRKDGSDYTVSGTTLTVTTAFSGAEKVYVERAGTFGLPAVDGGYIADVPDMIAGLRTDLLGTPFSTAGLMEKYGTLRNRKKITMLVIGQSNALGAAALASSTSTYALVRAWKPTDGVWVTANPGANQEPFWAGGGGGQQNFGWQAAKRLFELLGIPVDMIVIAEGGQRIDRFIATDADPSMWERVLAEVPAALTAAGSTRIDLVYWHQGEAEFVLNRGLLEFEKDLGTVYAQMKAQPWWEDGTTVMQIGGLVNRPQYYGGKRTVNPALKHFSDVHPDVGFIEADDLGSDTDADGVHFSDASYVKLGHRFADSSLPGRAPAIKKLTAVRVIEDTIWLNCRKTGNACFNNLLDMMEFVSKLVVGARANVNVNIWGGEWNLPIALDARSPYGHRIRYFGELSDPHTEPVVGNWAGTEATDLAMLEAKYLTKIVCSVGGVVFQGSHGGLWDKLLFVPASTVGAQNAFAGSEANDISGGRIRFGNTVIHNFSAANSYALFATGSDVDLGSLKISHCANGIFASQSRVRSTGNFLLAHTTGKEVYGLQSSMNLLNTKVVGASGTVYEADQSNIDARGADNNTDILEVRGGKVWTA